MTLSKKLVENFSLYVDYSLSKNLQAMIRSAAG
jgi:hypothetical protein